jgi:hypothetical protein
MKDKKEFAKEKFTNEEIEKEKLD